MMDSNLQVMRERRVNADSANINNELPFNLEMPALEDISTFNFLSNHEDDDEMADMNNLDTTIQVSPTLTIRIDKDHPVDQMDVKSTFLYGKIEEEVYVCQPPRFEDPYFPDKIYKVKKALYELHQAPRAWYETLSTYLLDNRFHEGKIDKILFIRRYKDDILLVQVYVDDIIFGSTKKELCNAFAKMMHKKFQMSSMGELKFFLGLQVKQKQNEIFISQDKHVAKILKKYGFTKVKNASTPIETQKPLLKDEDGEEVYVHMYRLMIGSLMYLTSLRHDIIFVVCACARYQVNPKVSHLHAVKRIFRCRLISWQCKKQTVVATSTMKAKYVAASSCCGQVLWIQNKLLDYGDNNIPAYTNRFQELALICTKFVSNETEKVDKYISGLPDNIYGNVKSSKPKTLDETIELDNDLMDQKLRTYAERKSDSKRKADDISRNNQQPFKRQNVMKAYNLGSAKKKTYEGNALKCTKCQRNHPGPCTLKCYKCGKIGHYAHDCRSTGNTNATNNRGGNGPNPRGNGCFECGNPGHLKRAKLNNKNRGNGNAQGWVYAVGNAERNGNATGDPDSNVVTGTFLLNNRYAFTLFDTGVDRSFVSTAFSSLIDIIPTPLDNHYDVELANRKIVGINIIIRGCTLNFLNHPFTIDLMPI
uniref:CCHC-type domain-containing protein n=1 Tax=Tanacetum cinerariifolium TaxID=118510 RepID=A0A6L2L8S9_TANCI|nr:hypothetical protein [Tanacetum cinerariifolium]